MAMLRGTFPGRLICGSGDMAWPARSLDMTSSDFFFWGYLKSKVYIGKPNTFLELKPKITEEIHEITPDVFGRVMENTVKRIRYCFDNNRAHLNDVIFKQ